MGDTKCGRAVSADCRCGRHMEWLYGRTHGSVAGSQHVLNFVVGLAGRGFTLPVFHHKVYVLRSTKGGTRTLTY